MEEVHLTATFSISPQSTYKSQMIGGYVRVQSLNIKHQDKSSKMFYIQASIFNLRENDKHFHDDTYCESYGENPTHFHDGIIQVLQKI